MSGSPRFKAACYGAAFVFGLTFWVAVAAAILL